MHLQKSLNIILAAALCVTILSSCGSTKPVESTAFPAESTTSISSVPTNLLESLTLTLPENIIQEPVSDTRSYFRADGKIIGGIEILDIAGQRDILPLEDEYADLAISVTRQVQDGEYDRSVDKVSGLADMAVDIIFRDGRIFNHYFFFGERVVYDVWVDHDVLDGQDMISILKTLHSPDIVNPQDSAQVNADTPILNLRIDLPDGIFRMPCTTTRLLFYDVPLEEYRTGENVVGGVEDVTDGADLETLKSVVAALGHQYLGGEYEVIVQKSSDTNVIAKVTTTSLKAKLVSYVVQVEEEVYAVWANTAIIAEEDILKIAESCQY